MNDYTKGFRDAFNIIKMFIKLSNNIDDRKVLEVLYHTVIDTVMIIDEGGSKNENC